MPRKHDYGAIGLLRTTNIHVRVDSNGELLHVLSVAASGSASATALNAVLMLCMEYCIPYVNTIDEVAGW